MSDLITELEAGARQLGLAEGFQRVEPATANEIVERARATFVEGNPRSWWLNLKRPHIVVEYANADGYAHLSEHWPPADVRCWFIVESAGSTLPVYNTDVPTVSAILTECSFFEYYLVSKDFTILLIENDHNEIVIARAI